MHLTFERKLLRIMRLTSIILLTCCLHVAAKTVSQTVTYQGTNVPLEKIFRIVEQQTGYFFIYNPSLLDKSSPVSVIAEQMPLESFLQQILRNQELQYVFRDKTIVIEQKKISAPNNLLPIAGIVKGVDGKPLANVSVTVKGTEKGTTTDAEGKFSIDVKQGDVLVVSSVGFGSKEVKINAANSSLVIALEISSSPLDEVQIIAYGETSKRFNTGNVSSVKSKDIERQPVNNPLMALQGRVPGLFIEQSTGLPGTGMKVRIQGQNSISNGNDPFYVVDGVPYPAQLLSNMGNITGNSGTVGRSGNPLNYLNPSNIESIEVLKDADATAIYGSRAANGAILITTKKGKAGNPSVSFNLQTGFGKVTRKLEVLNTSQYLGMRREALKNDGTITPSVTDYDINGAWDTTRQTDWQKELIGGTARYTDLQASVSGGKDGLQYLVGTGYHRESTVYPGHLFNQKGSVHFKLNNVSANGKWHLEFSANYLNDKNRIPSYDLTTEAVRLAPNAPHLYNEDGTLNWMPDPAGSATWTWVNPLSYLLNKYTNKTENFLSAAVIKYELLPGLELQSNFGYTNLQSDEVIIFPLASTIPEFRPFTQRGAQYGDSKSKSWIIEPQANYQQSFGKNTFHILLGATVQQNDLSSKILFGSGHNSDLVLEDIHSAAAFISQSAIASVYKYNALFGRINYNFSDKYILNLSARRDGSSRFGKDSRFHNFSAVGAAWIFSKESFIDRALPFLSFGKLKGSYGTTGNDQIPDYQFMSLYSPMAVGVPYQGSVAIEANSLTNPLLQWEETKKLVAGTELGFVRDNILLEVNYFRNRSSNQLLNYILPITTGFGSILRNFPATVQNAGWEISLTTKNISSTNFSWTSNVNLTFSKNKLVSFPNLSTSTYANELVIGQPVDIIKVYRLAGVNQETGVYEFYDQHGAPTSFPDGTIDKTTFINPSPKYYGGLQNSWQYKDFELTVFFQFVKQLARSYRLGLFPGSKGINQPVEVLARWQNPGDITGIQKFNADFSQAFPFINASATSDAGFSDASYIRLKNMSFSWRLPQRWLGKLGMQSVKTFIHGQNLLTFTNYKGLDPETRSSVSLPPLRVLTAGIQIVL